MPQGKFLVAKCWGLSHLPIVESDQGSRFVEIWVDRGTHQCTVTSGILSRGSTLSYYGDDAGLSIINNGEMGLSGKMASTFHGVDFSRS